MKKLFPASFAVPHALPVSNAARAFGAAIVFLVAGCAVLDTHQAKLDQQQLRDVLMDYTEDQILDNLIRAYNGRSIVHFDLSNITSDVTSKVTPTVGGSRMVTDVRTRTPTHSTVTTNQTTTTSAGQTVVNTVARTATLVGGVVETVAKPFTWGVGAERDNAITVQVDPVLDQPTVYAAYIKFLNTDVPKSPKVASQAPSGKLRTENAESDPTDIIATEPITTTGPEPLESPAETPTAVPTTPEAAVERLPAAGEKFKGPKPRPKKPPSTEPPPRVDLVLRDFKSIKSLRTDPPPTPTDVLVGKKWKDGTYYWIPTKYRKEFFDLCVATVVRGTSSPSAEKESAAVKEMKKSNAIERQRLLRGQ